jgi:uncharacterized protein YdbL (DUF1318 family)
MKRMILALALAALPLPALADAPQQVVQVAQQSSPLYGPKSQGLIGERPDGTLGYVVEQVPPNVVELVESTNARRLVEYQRIAAERGVTVDQVKVVFGQRLVSETPAGMYIMDGSGNWVRK